MHGRLNFKCSGAVNNIANNIEFLSKYRNRLPEDGVTNTENM
jgi:hypothetical protein